MRLRGVLLTACVLALAAPSFANAAESGQSCPPAKLAETDAALRDLWVGHAFWVRAVVYDTMTGDKAAAKSAEAQVVANAKQIAAAIEPFYGRPAADKFFALLATHYGAVKDYLLATVEGSKAKQETAKVKLLANADELAEFLSGANPNLPLDAVKAMLYAHGSHHMLEIDQLKARDYDDEAHTWTAMKDHMYAIADALGGALAKQFPGKFQ